MPGPGWWSWTSMTNVLLFYSVINEHVPFSLGLFLLAVVRRVLAAVAPRLCAVADGLCRRTTPRIFSNAAASASWSLTGPLRHTATLDKMAIHPDTRRLITADLDAFRRDDRPWKNSKRGYLLYGPPGTGKSTMVAAMANYLGYDVYDLDLAAVKTNADLRKLFLDTAPRSVLVVEDIDDHDFYGAGGSSGVTLSGLLNAVDGLWSACSSAGGQRLVVFTTTRHKDALHPALIRRGRMDVHLHLSYCGFQAFRVLAADLLGVAEHRLFADIRRLLDEEVDVTPAEVAHVLTTTRSISSSSATACLATLVEVLENRAGGRGVCCCFFKKK